MKSRVMLLFRRVIGLLALLVVFGVPSKAGTITLLHRDAVVWGQDQTITGRISVPLAGSATISVNGNLHTFTIPAPGDSFSVNIHIGTGTSKIAVRVDSAGVPFVSDTLRLTLGYAVRPDCFAYATVSGRVVTLHAAVIENPDSSALGFQWMADPLNPAPVSLSGAGDSTALCTIPGGAPPGEYYFSMVTWDAAGDTGRARTFVTVDSISIIPFSISTDHARWIDSAVVYGVTPYIFVSSGQFDNVTARIPELAQLGVTTIWVQPVYATHGGGQGYDVTDYFAVRTDLGGENQLRTLVATAHANGLRVLFDFVPNHTSLYHPYARDAAQYGALSHYYTFYQRSFDSAPYSSNYHSLPDGQMTFVYYFWTDLVNLDYSNPEVQRMIMEAGRYWVKKFDIDGYRVDAVWGVNARAPAFVKQWRLALKRIKPEILLLAEDKASIKKPDAHGRTSPFDQEFDAAYDWTNEPGWVSHWVWESTYSASSNPTIFNTTAENQRGQALRNSLANLGAGYMPNAVIFRFLENNDTFRFLATHDLARTKMAGALVFSLNGIPLIYNGQEIGAATHPYSTYSIFSRSGTIKSQDAYGLFAYYQQLAGWRRTLPALYARNFEEVTITPAASQYAFRRWSGTQNVFACVNMAASAAAATVSIPVAKLGLDSARTYYLTDLLNGQYVSGTPASLASASISMPAYTTRIFLLADSVVPVTSVESGALAELPTSLKLDQNYPNPFNPATTIVFHIPRTMSVSLKIYDLLGREVETLIDGELIAGRHEARFDGKRLASGVYFYVVRYGTETLVKKMILLR